MKILYITQLLPYPLDSGGKIKTYKTLKLLSKKHQIHLVCFVSQAKDKKYAKKLQDLCQKVKVFSWPLTQSRYKDIIKDVFLNFLSLTPFIFHRYFNPKMKKYLDDLLKKESFDTIHIDHLNMAQYLPKNKNCFWVLEEHNIESLQKLSIAKLEKFPFSLVFFWEAVRLYFKEIKWLKKFDYILALSQKDKEEIMKRGGKEKKIFVLPPYMKAKSLFSWGSKNILFIGSLSWWPNKDGFKWFYKNIFNHLKKKLPEINFIAVGKDQKYAQKEVFKNEKRVIFPGKVKNIKPFLKKAGVFIVPLRMGSGIRIKLLTALANGIPAVSTSKGAEGIALKKGNPFIIENNSKQFSERIYKILSNKKIANKMSKNGLEFIKKNYSNLQAEKILKKIYPLRLK